MSRAAYTEQQDFFRGISPQKLIERFGSPLYVYSEALLRRRCRDLTGMVTLPNFHVSYSVKANTNPFLLRIIREEGCLADAMSPGEMRLNMMAGFDPKKILYVSNNISDEEMIFAAESGALPSLDSLSQLERYGRNCPGHQVMVRINPGIGAGHHKKVITAGHETKFGVDPDALPEILKICDAWNLQLAGFNQHIGSLFLEPDGYLHAVDFLTEYAERLGDRFKNLKILDFGGGFGIPYHKYEGQARLDVSAMGKLLQERLEAWTEKTGYSGVFHVESGRYIVAESGLLLGRVTAVKNNGKSRYVGTDIGFNQLMRPILYDAFHDIEIYGDCGEEMEQTIVGNICESGDILARQRMLPEIQEDSILGILDAGAYGFAMASSYNQRTRPAEVLIRDDGSVKLIRRRETIEDLIAPYAGLDD
ncbi:MAG: diaminopimelate decarboxylase [Desulfovibrionaceae bacterium]|nr:diaminopimelate decarboxylase [Desulfovibrionaceae bacterium]